MPSHTDFFAVAIVSFNSAADAKEDAESLTNALQKAFRDYLERTPLVFQTVRRHTVADVNILAVGRTFRQP